MPLSSAKRSQNACKAGSSLETLRRGERPLTKPKKLLALLLCAALFLGCLSACARPAAEPEPEQESETPPAPSGTVSHSPTYADELFTLAYDPEAGLDPFSSREENALLFPLLYEGLFHVTAAFEAEPLLCESWESEDGLVWHFRVKRGVTFHDGSRLTADDVAASLNRARESRAYASRLRHVLAAYVLEGVLFIELDRVNRNLPLLLDVPVVKAGGGDRPVGTGPYAYTDDGETVFLKAYTRWQNAADLPLDRIYLRSYKGSELISAFDAGLVDLVTSSRAEARSLEFAGNTETRYMDETLFFFLGVNRELPFFAEGNRRILFSSALDRARYCEEVTGGVPVTIPLNPSASIWSADYDPFTIRPGDLQAAHISYLVEDYDEDGWLDYINKNINAVDSISLRLIVNKENPVKTELAHAIQTQMGELGYRIRIRELAWEDYLSALKNKNYDLFLGEIRLTADFDLNELLGLNGGANYCVFDPELQNRIDSFNHAEAEEKNDAAASLFSYIAEDLPIFSLLFARRTVYTHRETVAGLSPAPHDLFNNITEWEIKY